VLTEEPAEEGQIVVVAPPETLAAPAGDTSALQRIEALLVAAVTDLKAGISGLKAQVDANAKAASDLKAHVGAWGKQPTRPPPVAAPASPAPAAAAAAATPAPPASAAAATGGALSGADAVQAAELLAASGERTEPSVLALRVQREREALAALELAAAANAALSAAAAAAAPAASPAEQRAASRFERLLEESKRLATPAPPATATEKDEAEVFGATLALVFERCPVGSTNFFGPSKKSIVLA
jgi:hypothetical protein